jgi:beta-glucosidase
MEAAHQDPHLHKQLFGDHFIWGVSTAAFQMEGAANLDGKGVSIWDAFTKKKGKILNGDNADVACDFYHRYKEDIDLIHQLNIPNFRFSISWTRVLPNGDGEVNPMGILFYNNVINYCIEKGIEPWITIYHWDLPQIFEDKGGWTNRQIVNWFSYFVEVCARNFGDRVKNWMVINEPAVFTGAGYFFGIHAPGRIGIKSYLQAVHHAVLSMVAGAKKLRAMVPDAKIGTTFSCSHIEPYSNKTRDINAAKRADAFINRLFIEPILGLGYPVQEVPVLKGIEKIKQPGDDENMRFDFDFIGLQNYTREIVKCSYFTPYVFAKLVKAENRNVELTTMRWEVYPPAIYEVIKKFNAYGNIKEIYITENGSAFEDSLNNGMVDDQKRLKFLKDNLQQVLKAKTEGYKVNGYFVWTLTDNFEWAEGYQARFGLVYIDFKTQQRVIKSSGKWYAEFLK